MAKSMNVDCSAGGRRLKSAARHQPAIKQGDDAVLSDEVSDAERGGPTTHGVHAAA